MKIKQVEELVGITKKNIRFYEEQGLLEVKRAENGYREYGLKDVERLQQIRLLRKLSIPIEDMRQMFGGEKVCGAVWNIRSKRWNARKRTCCRSGIFAKSF